ncbi:hypothetical protein [Anaerophilus nitritogenes]|uniref:hypothetical protein n=1 Tax=Anaerophilus nitritogenes TaxID=2498136 RepID=UPI00101BDB22|nr:hypothetical protein [Anaerophilus nitritogenes]
MGMIEYRDYADIKKILEFYISKNNNQVVADLLSFYFFDEIIHIEEENGFFKLYWKNDDVQNMDEVIDIFQAHYIYLGGQIEKIKVVNMDRREYIVIKMFRMEHRDIRRSLGLPNSHPIVSSSADFFSELRYIKNNKVYQCIINDMPFFSVVLTHKPGPNIEYTTDFLRFMNLIDIEEQVESIKSDAKNTNKYDYMKISNMGNSLRVLLERALKFYNINLNSNYITTANYKKKTLNQLEQDVKKNNTNMDKLIEQKKRWIMNDYSHDSGSRPNLNDIEMLADYIINILYAMAEDL